MFRDAATNSGGTGSPTTPVPASALNDVILWWCSQDDNTATLALPAGFTLLANGQVSGGLNGEAWMLGYKIAGAAESGSYAGTSDKASRYVCAAASFSGRTADVSIGAITTNAAANASPVSIIAPSLIALEHDDLSAIWIPDTSVAGAGTGFTPPGGWTERVDTNNVESNTGMATKEDVAAGASGTATGTFTMSSGTAGWTALLVRIGAATVPATNRRVGHAAFLRDLEDDTMKWPGHRP